MLGLLSAVSWRHVARHRLRSLLTFFGIALGVAVVVAIAVVNRSLTSSFQSTIDQIAGKAVLQVANGESGVAESLFPLIRDTAGVRDAAPAVEGFLPVAGLPGEHLYVYGVDLLTDFAIREHQFAGLEFGFDQALDFIARPDSIAVTESLSRRLALPVGAKIVLLTSQGKREFTVQALLKEEGTATVFGGSFALMDLPAAQRAFGKEGKLDIVDLTVEEGESIEAVQRRLGERLQGAAAVERPRKRGEQIELLLTSFRVGLFFVSLIALFVCFFLIYNTVSVSVIQRKKEFGTLRCLGMKRSELLRLIVIEALLLALAGSISGALLGWLLARAALFVGGDSGPLHVAGTTKTPIVAIYGPTLPARSQPWRDPDVVSEAVEPPALPCRPCDQRTCVPGDFRCLAQITAEQVTSAAERALARAREARRDRADGPHAAAAGGRP